MNVFSTPFSSRAMSTSSRLCYFLNFKCPPCNNRVSYIVYFNYLLIHKRNRWLILWGNLDIELAVKSRPANSPFLQDLAGMSSNLRSHPLMYCGPTRTSQNSCFILKNQNSRSRRQLKIDGTVDSAYCGRG